MYYTGWREGDILDGRYLVLEYGNRQRSPRGLKQHYTGTNTRVSGVDYS